MRSIVMTAGCSGCGTAAVTAAVARQLALQGKKVLLVEATAGLRRMNRLLEIREEGLFDFSDLLEGRCALENALLPTRIAGLTLLQGPSAIDWVPEAADVQLLREELSGTEQYDALLWYCPPGAGALQKGLLPAAETLVATHPDLAARQLDPPVPERSWDRFEPQHDQMVRTGAASADITLRTSIGMTDETFARALAAAKAKGRNTVHVKVWLPLPAACPAQSNITLDSFTAQPTYIAPETAPQRTAYWEADLAENCRFGAQYSYRSTAHYAAPLEMQADPVQPDFDTAEQLPHIAFTPYMKALAAQLTEGITDPVQKAKRIYDFVTLNVHYHFQPMYFVHENITDNCARSRRGDCGVMAATFITLCRIAGIPAKWQSGMVARPETAGCHDWAMFYIAPKGWMYADCSAGASMARAGNEKMRLHYFGNLDTDRMVANSDICAPFDPPMCSFRADPCDNQVGEMEVDGVGLYGQQVETTQEIVKHQEV